MAALIRQANSGYEMANKPQIKKKKKKEEKNGGRKETINKLSKLRKRRQEMSASNVTMAGYTYSMYTIQPLSSDNKCGAADAHELPHTKKD